MLFLFSSCLLLLLGCEFLAFILIVIYVGAIAVLFLFVIMLLDLKIKNLKNNENKAISFVVCFCFILLANIIFFNFNFLKYEAVQISINELVTNSFVMIYDFNFIYLNWYDCLSGYTELETYSLILFDNFVVQFLLAGFILLIVLLGIVYLVNYYKTHEIVAQANFKQISINSNFFYN